MSTEICQPFDEIYEQRAESYATVRKHHLIEQVIGEITPVVADLEALLPTLPKVKPNGRSDCPFARDMFRKKEKLERKVRDKLPVLRDMSGELQQEIARCKRNLSRISVDAKKLLSSAIKDRYQTALGRQEQEYVEAVSTSKKVGQVIMRADATLSASSRKVFPGGTEDNGPDTPMPATATTDPLPTANGDGLRDEVDDLLSLGPI